MYIARFPISMCVYVFMSVDMYIYQCIYIYIYIYILASIFYFEVHLCKHGLSIM